MGVNYYHITFFIVLYYHIYLFIIILHLHMSLETPMFDKVYFS